MEITETLRKPEEKLQTHSIRTNAAAISSTLTKDFKEYKTSGRIFSKPKTIRELSPASQPTSPCITSRRLSSLNRLHGSPTGRSATIPDPRQQNPSKINEKFSMDIS